MPPSTAQKRSLEEKVLRFEQAGQTTLLPYLAGRGLGAVARERFRLGYVEPADDIQRAYWHRLAIPYCTPTGVVQIRYRCLADHHAPGQDAGRCSKFLGDTGQEVTLYNAAATLTAGRVLFLTEGEPDTWAIETLAGFPAVGIPGSQAWKAHPYWARCFVNFPLLILAADGDEAGAQLAATVAHDLPEIRIVQLPDGEDANSLLARDPDQFFARCGL